MKTQREQQLRRAHREVAQTNDEVGREIADATQRGFNLH